MPDERWIEIDGRLYDKNAILCRVESPLRGACDCAVCSLYNWREKLQKDFRRHYDDRGAEIAQRWHHDPETRDALLADLSLEFSTEWARHDPCTPRLIQIAQTQPPAPFILRDPGNG